MLPHLLRRVLDSSVWLESDTTRLTWITLLLTADEQGFSPLESIANVASRANIDVDEAARALKRLVAPDPLAAEKTFEGRYIEQVPGGWLLLGAAECKPLDDTDIRRAYWRMSQREQREKRRRKTIAAEKAGA